MCCIQTKQNCCCCWIGKSYVNLCTIIKLIWYCFFPEIFFVLSYFSRYQILWVVLKSTCQRAKLSSCGSRLAFCVERFKTADVLVIHNIFKKLLISYQSLIWNINPTFESFHKYFKPQRISQVLLETDFALSGNYLLQNAEI